VLSGIRGCTGCIWCQKRLKLSCKVDECKPLVTGLPSLQLFPRGYKTKGLHFKGAERRGLTPVLHRSALCPSS